jgi:hypothetical protein
MNAFAEYTRAVGNLDADAAASVIKRFNLPDHVLFGGPMLFGIDNVVIQSSLYQPDEAGEAALIVPVGRRCRGGVGWNEIWDLAAVPSARPETWALRNGVGMLLDEDAADRAAIMGEALPVWSTPLAWLRAGGVGTCVLSWSRPLGLYLGFVPVLAAENDNLGTALKEALRQPACRCEVRVIEGNAYAA